jgi:hypothetical protein
MNIDVDENEARILQELLERDLKDLLLEIARTDHRELRDELKARESMLERILSRLPAAPVA